MKKLQKKVNLKTLQTYNELNNICKCICAYKVIPEDSNDGVYYWRI